MPLCHGRAGAAHGNLANAGLKQHRLRSSVPFVDGVVGGGRVDGKRSLDENEREEHEGWDDMSRQHGVPPG